MLRRRAALLVPFLVFVAITSGHADTILMATLNNATENPPTSPTFDSGAPRTSFGTAMFDLNDAQTAMTFTATITGIDFTGSQTPDLKDNLIAAHIHAAPTASPTTNVVVVWGFFGIPFNDNSPNDVVISPFSSGVGGVISGKWDAPEGNNTTLAAQLPNILSGHAYINFHTNQFTGGEIRGFLVVTAVPEPASIVMLGTGAVAVLGYVRRCRRRARSID